ncbi:hypothetical protein H920_08149 [Fukomys damarensis]|uniref:Uncharacterized protein n=1 Tax=Fukomys damarensis TaxID=885580 RepID=A0A091DIV8_FUKDA|nr:hypothetical protein H920_08149 [Fukomys damarensis]
MYGMYNIPFRSTDAFLDKKASENVGAHLTPFCDLSSTGHVLPAGEGRGPENGPAAFVKARHGQKRTLSPLSADEQDRGRRRSDGVRRERLRAASDACHGSLRPPPRTADPRGRLDKRELQRRPEELPTAVLVPVHRQHGHRSSGAGSRVSEPPRGR